MPTLVIENGSGVEGANSFAEVADFLTFIDLRGVIDTPADDDAARLLVRAADRMREMQWLGEPVERSQALPWPRKNVVLKPHSELFPSNDIPREVEQGQMALAIEIAQQDKIREVQVQPGQRVVSEETVQGVGGRKYAVHTGGNADQYQKADSPSRALFKDFLVSGGLVGLTLSRER